MKKIKILVASLIIGSVAYAQQPPQGGAGNGINWRRGGNFGGPGAPNKFGTFWNSPIYTYTNGIGRMLINKGGTGSGAGRVAMGNNLPLSIYNS